MLGRKTKARPPLTYDAVPASARLNPVWKSSFNFARDISDLYAHTSISGLRKRSRSQPADQQGMLMGDINIVGPQPATAIQNTNFQEKVGGPRAATALTSRAQIASTFFDNQIGVGSATAAGGATLSQSGTTTTINVAAFTLKAGDQSIPYSSGSVDPGAFGTYFVYVDDPFYLGHAVIYKATTVLSTTAAAIGRFGVGKITTSGAGGGSGGGDGGGGGGGRPLQ